MWYEKERDLKQDRIFKMNMPDREAETKRIRLIGKYVKHRAGWHEQFAAVVHLEWR